MPGSAPAGMDAALVPGAGAAIDVVDDAADIGGAVRGEEGDEAGDLLGLAGSPERQLLHVVEPARGIAVFALGPGAHQRDDAVGLGRAGVDADDPDAVIDAAAAERPGEGDQRGVAGAAGDIAVIVLLAGEADDV